MRRLELPPALANGSFSVLAADAAGIPRKRTRAQDLIIVSRGVRVPAGSSAQGAAALRAYCQLDDCTVLCHFTAARIWRVGLPLWADSDWRIHLARPRGGSIPKRANAPGRRLALRPGDVVMLDGVRVTSPERISWTWRPSCRWTTSWLPGIPWSPGTVRSSPRPGTPFRASRR